MIYIHVPFCRSFCTYCGFYSEIARGDGPFQRYADAVVAEIGRRSGEITSEVNTLYIGGGTPSALPLAVLKRIVEALPPARYDEFTVEVNPEDIVEKGLDYVRGLLDLGVNRVSVGVQSFEERLLRWMNRRHDAAGALKAIEMLREGGIVNLSMDLIFGLPQLEEDGWSRTLSAALQCAPQHISAYQLSVEPGSALEEWASNGRYREASEEQCVRQYDLLCARLSEAGYRHYEISNFAVPGYEAKHNSAYWRRVPYVGLGPGAHSFDGKRRRWNTVSISDYLSESEELSSEDEKMERIMLSLRTDTGIEAVYLHENCSRSALDVLLSEGALARCGDRIRIPEDHFFVSDRIIGELI